jgi:hypothetical protein
MNEHYELLHETQLIADFLNQNGNRISSYIIHREQNKDVEMQMVPFPFTPHDQNVGSRQMSADWRVDQ